MSSLLTSQQFLSEKQGSSPGSPAYSQWLSMQTHGAVTGFQILSQSQLHPEKSVSEESLKASRGASHDRGDISASAEASGKAKAGDALAEGHTQGSLSGHWDRASGPESVEYSAKHTEYVTLWKVRIGVDVAKYRHAAGAKLTRVVVALPHTDTTEYEVGDRHIAATKVAQEIRTNLDDALTQTHRFTVLDRQDNANIQQELDLVRSGNASVSDTARLGQMLATDLIVIPTIDRFEYRRHVRNLRLSGRKLEWYTGGGNISLRVVNAATGQLVMSQSFKYQLPDSEPTTLGASADGASLASKMMGALDHEIISTILQNTFPPAVLQLNGRQVTINQGGDLVQAGAKYQAVYLGKNLVDPQSGISLGPSETPCCTVQIDRVTLRLSYGHIVDESFHAPMNFKPGSMELRGVVVTKAAKAHDHEAGGRAHKHLTIKHHALAKKAKAQNQDENW
ncbi:CsgG/HfaB family protein [Oleiagrimonas sp. MCCC 1A03011]|uniref:CsgG/HfaB family protein n=1 Tax=Oleiagrimonas sp. MCCC 1A03011 TaxID=1926883 RepID=UPI00143D89F0|nr:CsgG/HfaB family protein [Oleiagrimonas sp. MCCC 1A03011]